MKPVPTIVARKQSDPATQPDSGGGEGSPRAWPPQSVRFHLTGTLFRRRRTVRASVAGSLSLFQINSDTATD